MLYDDSTAGETYELYGPKNYSTAEISELVDREIIKERRHINVPKSLMKPLAYYLNKFLWWPTTSADEVEREFINQQIDPTAKTFKDLNIEPAEISNLTFHYLVRFDLILTLNQPDAYRFSTERIQERSVLRSPPVHRTRGARGKEISPCPRRPVAFSFVVFPKYLYINKLY